VTNLQGARPAWDVEFDGLMAWELDRLREVAHNVVVDQKTLAQQGSLEVDFEWPLGEEVVPLRAVYPASYPYFRPHVFLRSPPEDWPDRHISPLDGGLCLLGRDSAQWQPESFLVELLQQQLEHALKGTGDQDPQAEPAEYWWNQRGLSQCYLLVDSDWNLTGANGGTLSVEYEIMAPSRGQGHQAMPIFRGVVSSVYDAHGNEIARWNGAKPKGLAHSCRVNWHRLPHTVYPRGDHWHVLNEVRRDHPRGLGIPAWAGNKFRLAAFVHPVELTLERSGDGWLVAMDYGPSEAFQLPKHSKPIKRPGAQIAIIPVLRAGISDLGVRVPAVQTLAGKTIAVVGTGALGAPIAIELARNGAAKLRLLDHDSVEPGNSVRWPLGASAWGMHKTEALQRHLADNYVNCEVASFPFALGAPAHPDVPSDDKLMQQLLEGVTVVVDASASESVNRLVWQRCQDAGVPLVRLGATPRVKGGTVALHAVGGGCPVCLQYARLKDAIPKPAGHDDIGLIQPVACGERTFEGADFDLEELSLQAMRVVTENLSSPGTQSIVYTLSLRDANNIRIPPKWDVSILPIDADCRCHRSKE